MCLTTHNYVTPPDNRTEREREKRRGVVVDTAPAAEQVAEEGNRGEVRRLFFGRLYGRIETATYRTKSNKIIITLKKKVLDKRAWMTVIM